MTLHDEFSSAPVSRQRKYQLRHQKQDRCTICNLPLSKRSTTVCDKHLILARKRSSQSRLSDKKRGK